MTSSRRAVISRSRRSRGPSKTGGGDLVAHARPWYRPVRLRTGTPAPAADGQSSSARRQVAQSVGRRCLGGGVGIVVVPRRRRPRCGSAPAAQVGGAERGRGRGRRRSSPVTGTVEKRQERGRPSGRAPPVRVALADVVEQGGADQIGPVRGGGGDGSGGVEGVALVHRRLGREEARSQAAAGPATCTLLRRGRPAWLAATRRSAGSGAAGGASAHTATRTTQRIQSVRNERAPSNTTDQCDEDEESVARHPGIEPAARRRGAPRGRRRLPSSGGIGNMLNTASAAFTTRKPSSSRAGRPSFST